MQRAEDSASQECLHREGNMAGYETGMANEPEEEKEEENDAGNCKQPARNLVGEVTAGQKKARRGHARKGRGIWPGMRQG